MKYKPSSIILTQKLKILMIEKNQSQFKQIT